MKPQQAMTPAAEQFPRPLGDRYMLLARLGVGGMGVVYRARQQDTGEIVAVKILRVEYSTEATHAERFLREARSVARIDNPNVVRILDLGQAPNGELFFVMELLDGDTLASVHQREGRLSPRRAVRIGVQICRALQAAHERGIVHRDLKMGNILLVRRGDEPDFVKVFDFGVAKVADEVNAGLTKSGVLIGTPDCMAPEQIENGQIDPRTDVYALGVMLFRILAGSPVFQASGIAAMVNHHLNTRPDSLLERVPTAGIPPALDAVVQRCMAKRQADRFPSMAHVEEALLESLEGTTAGVPMLEEFLGLPNAPELDTAPRSRERTAPDVVWQRPTGGEDRDAAAVTVRGRPFQPNAAPATGIPVLRPAGAEAEAELLEPTVEPLPEADSSEFDPAELAKLEPTFVPEDTAVELPPRPDGPPKGLPVLPLAIAAGLVLGGLALFALFGTGEPPTEPAAALAPAGKPPVAPVKAAVGEQEPAGEPASDPPPRASAAVAKAAAAPGTEPAPASAGTQAEAAPAPGPVAPAPAAKDPPAAAATSRKVEAAPAAAIPAPKAHGRKPPKKPAATKAKPKPADPDFVPLDF